MSKILKTILIAIIAVAGAGFLLVSSAKAVSVDNLVVQFQNTPLFQDGDTKPCDITSRWIKVTNNSDQTQPIAIEAISFPTPILSDDLSRALTILIKEGFINLYGPKTLAEFYQAGETPLSNLASGATTQYDVTISFPCEKENEWQEKTTGFDLKIGFVGGQPVSVCGNNIKEGSEQCDGIDGVPTGYHCTLQCTLEQNGGLNAMIVSEGVRGGNGPIGPSDAYQNWLQQQVPPGEVKGESTENPPGMGGAEGEVKGASTFLPATGFDFREFVILMMILLSLIGLRVILKKKSAAVA